MIYPGGEGNGNDGGEVAAETWIENVWYMEETLSETWKRKLQTNNKFGCFTEGNFQNLFIGMSKLGRELQCDFLNRTSRNNIGQ